MSDHDLEDTIALLRRTPAALDALLRDLPDAWTHRNEGESTWTVCEVIGHLIHGELTDWIPRATLILEHDDVSEFEPFDRNAHLRASDARSINELLDEFSALRAANLDQLSAWRIGPLELAKQARHPALGEVTLSQLLATWAVHDLTHLHQISRVMAHQYGEVVGPWRAYLGVLQCTGHSS